MPEPDRQQPEGAPLAAEARPRMKDVPKCQLSGKPYRWELLGGESELSIQKVAELTDTYYQLVAKWMKDGPVMIRTKG